MYIIAQSFPYRYIEVPQVLFRLSSWESLGRFKLEL